MGNKQQLINYLKSNYVPGKICWKELADKYGYSSGEQVRGIWKNYRKSKNLVEAVEDSTCCRQVEGDLEKGSFKSTMVSDFEPKNEKELADLHKVDLTRYRIKNYWSKLISNGKFTSSVFCVERKLGDAVDKETLVEAVSDFFNSKVTRAPIKLSTRKTKPSKSLVFFLADEHVGASVTDGLYENKWDIEEYYGRKSYIPKIAFDEASIHGDFDKVVVCNLGDTMDGFSGQTTRGGHSLQQSMTNKEAIKTYLEVSSAVLSTLVGLGITNSVSQYNVENSNHGGLGWDAAANIALDAYMRAKYPKVWDCIGFDSIIGTVFVQDHALHLTHGKDEKYMKRNLPLHLDAKTESYLKEYLEINKFTGKNHFVKGDLHKFATEQGKYFSYTNVPSLFGSSAWVMANFGNTRPGLCYSVIENGSSSIDFKVKWF